LEYLDIQFTQAINRLSGQSALADMVMIAITDFAVPIMVLAVAMTWWQRNDRRAARHVAAAGGMSFILGLALNQIILLMVHRVRPYDGGVSHLIIAASADPSFPSDHATAAFSIVFAFVFNRRHAKAFAAFLAAGLLALSRIYVGTHYAGDIAGGILTALAAAVIVKMTFREQTRLDNFLTGIL
jgi:undecaprenyl-diphosphatase